MYRNVVTETARPKSRVTIVRISVLDETKRCCPLDHGTVNKCSLTIVKLPSQNFSHVVRFKLLLRNVSLRAFFLNDVRFDLRKSVSFFST